jgi:uncharacterized membrane protein YdbT with pleckstrin-like domain
VAFPEDILTEDEELVLHVRPHWRAAIRPVLVLVLALAAVIMAWVMLPDNRGGWIGVWLVVAVCGFVAVSRGVRPLVVWRCTHVVFTDERIVVQDGVLRRVRRDLPLNRINDHGLTQGLVQRMFGSGTITVDALGERGPAILADLPHAVRAQTTLYELIENAPAEDDEETDQEADEPEQPVRRRR